MTSHKAGIESTEGAHGSMAAASRDFQIFVKPVGAVCNLACAYCYYLSKESLYRGGGPRRMPDDLLEEYIVQHIDASPGPTTTFSWHGGEPTILGLDYFRRIVEFQRRHTPPGRRITNGIQTNGTLLTEDWCHFLAEEGFTVGLSLDGPEELHDRYRITKDREPTHRQVMRGYELLRRHGVSCDMLCVLHAGNVRHPLRVYRFFKEIDAQYLGFLPLVERTQVPPEGVSDLTVPAPAFGEFLCTVFDEWLARDIGRIKVQIFEEAARTAFGREHALCIFRKTCGDIPVIEHNGDFFSCDHFVGGEHRLGNIRETSLVELLESRPQRSFGQAKLATLPSCCRTCEVLSMCNGACPKDRFLTTPEGEGGLNYLCAGYKRFFTHCRPFVRQISALWRGGAPAVQPPRAAVPGTAGTSQKVRIGRNAPCPCGSGKKYKKCCLGRG